MSKRHTQKPRAFLWHRRIGLVAFVLVIILAITGIMLNHTNDLKLDTSYIKSSALLDWYGLEPSGNLNNYRAGSNTISQWDKTVFFNNAIITSTNQTLHGAILAERFIVAAFDTELLLLSNTGELIERMPTSGSFSDIQRIGIKFSHPIIETSKSMYYMADEHILNWNAVSNKDITWSASITLNEEQINKLRNVHRGNGLSMERVILDIHSGRFFGQFGIYVMDAAAIALLWLSLSGLWVWWRRSVKQKKKKHYQKHHRY